MIDREDGRREWYVHTEKPKYWAIMGRVSSEFYEKLSPFGPEYRMWRMRPGSAGLILISRLLVEEVEHLK